MIAKRYYPEKGTDFANILYEFEFKRGRRLYTAEHSISEVGSAIYRKMREGKLTQWDATTIVDAFLRESASIMDFIETRSDLYLNTLDMLKNHFLRAGDAVHLSAALEVRTFYGNGLRFVCDDSRLCGAAAAEGLWVMKPTDAKAMDYLREFAR